MEEFDYTNENDENLLIYLQLLIEENPDRQDDNEFNDIFTEFYNRNIEYVYNICFKFYKSDTKAKEAAQDTFIQIFKSIKTFDSNKLKRNRLNPVKGWIGVITNNIIFGKKDTLGIEHKNIALEDWLFTDLIDKDDEIINKKHISKYRIAFEKAIEKLSERDKNLLYAYYNHLSFENKSRLPKGKLSELAEMFNVEKENFTKIRQRVIKKLKRAAQTELSKLSP